MTEVHVEITVDRGVYEYNDKKYINFKLDDRVAKIIKTTQKANVDIDPLDENGVLKVKIPFRYRKFECKVNEPNKTIYDYDYGKRAVARIKCCGVWEASGTTGYAWKLVSIG